jgi:MerR family transcriptional regulator, copper efflux regulator
MRAEIGGEAMKPLSIGEVARRVGIGVETVRFYERQGLISDPARSLSGYRQYDEETVARLLFIRQAKELGFTLNEIKELLSLRFDPTSSCADVKGRAEAKIADVEEKIRTLQRIKKALVRLTEACSGDGPIDKCPILAAIEPAKTGKR